MASEYKLVVLTPSGKVLSDTVESIVVPACDGLMGILAAHSPIISILIPGALKIKYKNGKENLLQIGKGFLEVENNVATVLTEKVES